MQYLTPLQHNGDQLVLDHIAIAARTLNEGVDHVRDALGIEMPSGGAHPRMGTHNRLLSLGPDFFLEIISIDPDAPMPDRPRWFGLDKFNSKPRLGTWVLGTADIRRSLVSAHPQSGRVVEISRADLTWLISIPDDGSMPLSGAFPTLIEWPSGSHPAQRMEDRGCTLTSLTITHPEIRTISSFLKGKIDDPRIRTQSGPFGLKAIFDTPNGQKELR